MLLLENGVCAEVEAMGAEVIYFDDESSHLKEPLLKDLKEVDKLKVPDLYKTRFLCQNC